MNWQPASVKRVQDLGMISLTRFWAASFYPAAILHRQGSGFQRPRKPLQDKTLQEEDQAMAPEEAEE